MSAGVGGGLFAISSLGTTQIHLDEHPEGAGIRIESPALSAVVVLDWRVAEKLGAELLARACAIKAAARRRQRAPAAVALRQSFPVVGRTMAEILRGEEAAT